MRSLNAPSSTPPFLLRNSSYSALTWCSFAATAARSIFLSGRLGGSSLRSGTDSSSVGGGGGFGAGAGAITAGGTVGKMSVGAVGGRGVLCCADGRLVGVRVREPGNGGGAAGALSGRFASANDTVDTV